MQRVVPILRRYSTEPNSDLLRAFWAQRQELEMLRQQAKETQESIGTLDTMAILTMGTSAFTAFYVINKFNNIEGLIKRNELEAMTRRLPKSLPK